MGPIRQGAVEKGKEARFRFDSEAGCFAWLVVGEGPLSTLDVSVLSSSGDVLAKGGGNTRDTVVKACVPSKGTYQVAVKGGDSGELIVAMYKGGAAVESGPTEADGAGTCASPKVLNVGTTSGSTASFASNQQGSCGGNESPEVVYRLELTEKQRVTLELDPRFDSVLYVRRDACEENDFEVACNDDAGPAVSRGGSNSTSTIDGVWDPGKYFVFIDGNNGQSGAYRLTTTLGAVPTLADTCRAAKPLSLVQQTNGNLTKSFPLTGASCGDGAKGPEIPYTLEIPVAARVRIAERANGFFTPTLHLRKQCESEADEIGCSEDAVAPSEAVFTGSLAAGRYFVFADSADVDASGAFDVEVETDVEPGSGAGGDTCASALQLASITQTVEVDTFTAKDDVAGKCGGAGAPDVMYRFDLRKRMRVIASVLKSETAPLFSIASSCGDRSKEIACGKSVDQILPAGSYFMVVDGSAPGKFGRSSALLQIVDIDKQESACRAAPLLRPAQTISGTTTGAGDKFRSSCSGVASSADKQYKLVLSERTKVRIELNSPSFEGVLSIRKSCLELPGGASAEVTCNKRKGDPYHAQVDRTLDAGTYFVSVDGVGPLNDGAFTLHYQVMK